MNFAAVFASLGAIEKMIPVLEAIGTEIGPFVQAEVTNGEVLWADIVKSFTILKTTIAAVKVSAANVPPKA